MIFDLLVPPQGPRRQGPKLEDLKALRRSPDLPNNVKIGQGHYSLYTYFVLPSMSVAAILVK